MEKQRQPNPEPARERPKRKPKKQTPPELELEIPESQTEAVESALKSVWKKLHSDSSKPSVADLIRLLQLRQELKEDQPQNITVRWVDRCSDRPSEE